MKHFCKLGADNLAADSKKYLGDKKLGILAHGASCLSQGMHLIDALVDDLHHDVRVIFGPEHGLFTKAQYMESVGDSSHPRYKIPVKSLYGSTFESLSPSPASLNQIEALVVDLQDVGSRYYTYVWTLVLSMKACSKAGLEIIVCDRPNPIGGIAVEGAGIKKGYESFVGLHSLAVRHGMTIGEIASYMNAEQAINSNLRVIKMTGWERRMLMSDTGLKWTNPSPNMRSQDAALVYPGMCLIEATNLSEGRGTKTPFELIGAPFIDSNEFAKELNALKVPGMTATPVSFVPSCDKWEGKRCNGVSWKALDAAAAKPYLAGLATIWAANKMYKGRGFEWRASPYEFVSDIPAIDLLTGSDFFRKNVDGAWENIISLDAVDEDFAKKRKIHLFYE